MRCSSIRSRTVRPSPKMTEWVLLHVIACNCTQSKNDGMGAIAGYDMRVHTERDPLPALQKIGEGAFNGTVTRSGSAYTKDWTAGAGTMITYADVQ